MNSKHIQAGVQTRNSQDLVKFLDITVDDEDKLAQPPLWDVVANLIGEAQEHKSFPTLLKLQAVKSYLKLLSRYHRILNIKNPITWAGLVVAKSVEKGPYFV